MGRTNCGESGAMSLCESLKANYAITALSLRCLYTRQKKTKVNSQNIDFNPTNSNLFKKWRCNIIERGTEKQYIIDRTRSVLSAERMNLVKVIAFFHEVSIAGFVEDSGALSLSEALKMNNSLTTITLNCEHGKQ